MKAQVKLYNVGFNSNMNCVVDDIAAYLRGTATTVITYDDVMYQKIELDMELKLPLTQSLNERPSFNYISILNDDGQRPFYFFVRDVQWLSQQGLRILLSMDTLNTFQDLLVFSNNTKITRQHKDRFYQAYYNPSTPQLATRKIDRVSEVAGLTKYRGNTTSVNASNELKWYLIYANEDEQENSPVNCYLMANQQTSWEGSNTGYNYSYINSLGNTGDTILFKGARTITITKPNSTTETLLSNSDTCYYITIQSDDATYSQMYARDSSGTRVYDQPFVRISFASPTDATVFPANSLPLNSMNAQNLYDVGFNGMASVRFNVDGSYVVPAISELDRTSTKLIKIIECPYCPVNISYNSTTNKYTIPSNFSMDKFYAYEGATPIQLLQLEKVSIELQYNLNSYQLSDFTCIIPLADNRQWTRKDVKYESKLYHSDFHNLIFNYDSFTKDIPLENIEPSSRTNPYFSIKYKQANTITSNLGFKFEINNANRKLNDKFEEYLVCKRNNEYPIFNSSYLNYLRNGYNYDIKARGLQATQGAVSAAISFGAGVASMLASGATGGVSAALGVSLITSAITSITTSVFSGIQNEANIEQKLNEAKNTTNSVNSSDDLNLLNWYSDNLLWATTYDISDQQKSNVFDLFFKTGYACNETGTPNVHSRYRFNFLQCTPDFTTKANPIWQEYINDVVARFELGVTYFHTYSDFDQQYENWESWLMP